MEFTERMLNYFNGFLTQSENEMEDKIKLIPLSDLQMIETLTWKFYKLSARECNRRERDGIGFNGRG